MRPLVAMRWRRFVSAFAVLSLIAPYSPTMTPSAQAAPTELFFSEYVEGSSNNKALEIFNGTGAAVNLTTGGYQVEMYLNGSASAGLTIPLTGTVANGDVFVLAHASANPTILAQADQTNSSGWYNGNDAVVLRKGGAGGTIVDVIGRIGFDPGTEWGSGDASTADNTLRRKSTVQAGDTNGSNTFTPSGEWDGFPLDTFSGLGSHTVTNVDSTPAVSSTVPTNGAIGVALNADITVNFSESVNVAGAWFTISCATTGLHTAAVSPAGPATTFTLNPNVDFGANELCTVTILSAQVTDQDSNDPPDNMAANFVFTFRAIGSLTLIRDIQGAGHISPKNSQLVSNVNGIVTAIRSNGFYMQDPVPDSNIATSEGIFVFTSSAPSVNVQDAVRVAGTVSEFRGSTSGCNNLANGLGVTQIGNPSVNIVSSGNTLPAPIVIGAGGRVPPTAILDDDSPTRINVETSGVFDTANDGVDFYESLEGMRVQINNAVVTDGSSSTISFGEVPVLPDNGIGSGFGLRTARGGIFVRPNDFNPERVVLDDTIMATPSANVGDTFPGETVGVMDYSFCNFKLNVTQLPSLQSGGLQKESTTPQGTNQFAVATFNVENLDPGDSTFDELAGIIVNRLMFPDLVLLEEIQDNNGPTNDGTVAANLTYAALIQAIQTAGGPTYQFRQIDPQNNQDGGEPGGNIRIGFLFRTDRGLSFVDRPGGDAVTPTVVNNVGGQPQLSISPGRINPTSSAFTTSRKPLVGEFLFNGRKVFVIGNHFNSKGGDEPLFGKWQPQNRISEVQRHQQATIVNTFVNDIRAIDPTAKIIVLGDLNDFEFSQTLTLVKGDDLVNLVEDLPQNERYTYVFEGNSQVLDHILVSTGLKPAVASFDVVHVNAEFADQDSDHDPSVARLNLPPIVICSASPNSIRPPNHSLVAVNTTVTVVDGESGPGGFKLVSVTSNEPDSGTGPEDIANDIQNWTIGDPDTSGLLRAERTGEGTGRVYTLTYEGTDIAGNYGVCSTTVTVAHN